MTRSVVVFVVTFAVFSAATVGFTNGGASAGEFSDEERFKIGFTATGETSDFGIIGSPSPTTLQSDTTNDAAADGDGDDESGQTAGNVSKDDLVTKIDGNATAESTVDSDNLDTPASDNHGTKITDTPGTNVTDESGESVADGLDWTSADDADPTDNSTVTIGSATNSTLDSNDTATEGSATNGANASDNIEESAIDDAQPAYPSNSEATDSKTSTDNHIDSEDAITDDTLDNPDRTTGATVNDASDESEDTAIPDSSSEDTAAGGETDGDVSAGTA